MEFFFLKGICGCAFKIENRPGIIADAADPEQIILGFVQGQLQALPLLHFPACRVSEEEDASLDHYIGLLFTM